MPGRLDTRLARLENGHGRECPECGFDGDWSKVKIEVTWADIDGENPDDERPEYCPECGHQLIYVVTWMDLEEVDPWA